MSYPEDIKHFSWDRTDHINHLKLCLNLSLNIYLSNHNNPIDLIDTRLSKELLTEIDLLSRILANLETINWKFQPIRNNNG